MKKNCFNSILLIISLVFIALISGRIVQGFKNDSYLIDPNKIPVNQTDTFDLWLLQDTKGIVNEDTNMTFGVRSHFSGPVDVILGLYESDPPMDAIYQENIQIAELIDYEFNFSYNFTSPGQHLIIYEAYLPSSGEHWYEYYYWAVYEDGYCVLSIIQDNTTYLGSENIMYFSVTNHYLISKNLTLQVEIYNGTFSILVYDHWISLDPSQTYNFDVSYTFDDTGNYGVLFNVTEMDTLNLSWLEYCYWTVGVLIPELTGLYTLPLLIITIVSMLCVRKRNQ